MRPLVIDDAARARIAEVIAYAEAERLTMADILAMGAKWQRAGELKGVEADPAEAPQEAVGDDLRRRCELAVGYRVVFSIEKQPAPLGWCRHLSMSVTTGETYGHLPDVVAVAEVARLFGFRHALTLPPHREQQVWLEWGYAVNVVEPLEALPE